MPNECHVLHSVELDGGGGNSEEKNAKSMSRIRFNQRVS